MDGNARRRPPNATNQYHDHEDDVTVLTGPKTPNIGDGRLNYNKPPFYSTPVATCSRKQAIIIIAAILLTLLICSLIIAFVRPSKNCGNNDSSVEMFENVKPTSPPIALATNGEIFPWNDIRLPGSIFPFHYSITVYPNISTMLLQGDVKAMFSVVQETNFIVLHGKNLTLTEVMVKDTHEKEIPVSRTLYYPYHQQIYLELKSNIQVNSNYSLAVKYRGRIQTALEGIYLSSYSTQIGLKRFLVTTHFQPTFARAAFPCWDEPHLKARFKMAVIRQRDFVSISNMPHENTEDVSIFWGSGLVKDNFQESLPMSTYLIALVVCDYSRIYDKTSSGVTINVYAPQHLISQAQFSLNVAVKLLDFYQGFFGVPYPLPKQDLVAIPDFAAGAMENWGLVTFRESALLLENNYTSAFARQRVVVIIAHELAHQWFGNLVTMNWWNDLWLNEGFASYVEYLGVHHVFPEWNMMDQFVQSKTQAALHTDALSTSHPISLSVSDPVDIESIFDTISYNKGAAILYMLQRVLGDNLMRHGLTLYLERYKYGNANTDDLWESLTTASHKSSHPVDVKVIMDSWTQQLGFPLVTLQRHGNEVLASQRHFLLVNFTADVNSTTKWHVPLSYITSASSKTETQIWMQRKDVTFKVSANVTWVKANVNQSGYYRVNYDNDTWKALIRTLTTQHTVFSPADRAQLLDDAFTLNLAGLLNISVPLTLSTYLRNETEYLPWATALKHFRKLDSLLSFRTSRRAFHCHVRYILTPLYAALGWSMKSGHVDSLLQREILEAAVHFGLSSAVNEARRLFQQWMSNNIAILPDIRHIIYSTGIKYGGWTEWEYCWQRYKETTSPDERLSYLRALAASNDPWILQQYLDYAMEQNFIRVQDMRTVIENVASNPVGSLLVWRQFQTRWKVIESTLGQGTFTMGRLIVAAISHFNSPLDLKNVETFFKTVNVGSGKRSLHQSLEIIHSNIYFLNKYDQELTQWLNRNALRC